LAEEEEAEDDEEVDDDADEENDEAEDEDEPLEQDRDQNYRAQAPPQSGHIDSERLVYSGYGQQPQLQAQLTAQPMSGARRHYSGSPLMRDFDFFLDSTSRSSGERDADQDGLNHNQLLSTSSGHGGGVGVSGGLGVGPGGGHNYRYSPETTDYDSNCGDLDSKCGNLKYPKFLANPFRFSRSLRGDEWRGVDLLLKLRKVLCLGHAGPGGWPLLRSHQ